MSKKRLTIGIESVNEASGLLSKRIGRMIRLLDKHTGKETEGVTEALKQVDEYLNNRMPRIVQKTRDKLDLDVDLAQGILQEDSIT